jgi:pyrimidine-nucleoside phosphorylase
MRSIIEMISAKRDGRVITDEEWSYIANGAAQGSIPDYQLAAFLMACYCHPLSDKETESLITAIRDSGKILHVNGGGRPRVDKHSTGGVGDKVSLICAPLAATCGLCVPMVAGRGLGWTGGTVDKLESIPGVSLSLAPQRFQEILDEAGFCIGAQTDDIAPADRKLYALRDITATVDSIPLIVGSIMGKKLATEADGLVLTVMWGSGAFMHSREKALELGKALKHSGEANGRKVVVLLVNMDWPLGRYVGNLAETVEVIKFFLEGSLGSRLWEVVRATTGAMLLAGGLVKSIDEGMGWLVEGEPEGRVTIGLHEELLSDGFHNLLDYLEILDGLAPLKEFMATANWRVMGTVKAPHVGYLLPRDCSLIGRALTELGGGRSKMDDKINPYVAIECLAGVGEKLNAGQPIFRVLDGDGEAQLTAGQVAQALELLKDSFSLEEIPYEPPLVWEELK